MKSTWTSFGGCSTVTGSQHLLKTPQGNFLLECGLFQGKRKDAWKRNQKINFEIENLNGIILSHAHIDHCGKIPYLVKHGFNKSIYCTPYTAELLEPLLLDCAHIMEDDHRYLKRKSKNVLDPLYKKEDVKNVLKLIQPVDYEIPFEVQPKCIATFYRAAHILGSAFVEIKIPGKNILFTGDLGPHPSPFLKPQKIPENINHIFIESTYGGRLHKPFEENLEDLRIEIKRIQETKGRIIIPAFAMERTQYIVALLNYWMSQKIIEPIHIYMDSPLGIRLTQIYENAQGEFNTPFSIKGNDIFKSPWIHVMQTVGESISINSKEGPMIIISSSGMCEGGRILHHIKNNCHDPKNTILIVGFQAEHTLGRRIVERTKKIKIYGSEYPLKCRVKALNGFSAHGDQEDLIKLIRDREKTLHSVNLLHGEESQRLALQKKLKELLDFSLKDKIFLVEENQALDI